MQPISDKTLGPGLPPVASTFGEHREAFGQDAVCHVVAKEEAREFRALFRRFERVVSAQPAVIGETLFLLKPAIEGSQRVVGRGGVFAARAERTSITSPDLCKSPSFSGG